MYYRANRPSRRGSILPLVTVCLISLMGFVALAIDLGVLQVARTQCQNAADSAAIAGARALTGDVSTSYNKAGALPAAQKAAGDNSVIGTSVDTAKQVQIQV